MTKRDDDAADEATLQLRADAESLAHTAAEEAERQGYAFPSAGWREAAERHVRNCGSARLHRIGWPIGHAVELLDSMIRDGFIPPR